MTTPSLELLGADRVAVRSVKSLVILTAAEILELLRGNPSIWVAGLRRGKCERRAAATSRRAVRS